MATVWCNTDLEAQRHWAVEEQQCGARPTGSAVSLDPTPATCSAIWPLILLPLLGHDDSRHIKLNALFSLFKVKLAHIILNLFETSCFFWVYYVQHYNTDTTFYSVFKLQITMFHFLNSNFEWKIYFYQKSNYLRFTSSDVVSLSKKIPHGLVFCVLHWSVNESVSKCECWTTWLLSGMACLHYCVSCISIKHSPDQN